MKHPTDAHIKKSVPPCMIAMKEVSAPRTKNRSGNKGTFFGCLVVMLTSPSPLFECQVVLPDYYCASRTAA